MRLLLIGDTQKSRRLLSMGLTRSEETDTVICSQRDDLARLASDVDFSAAVVDWDMRAFPAAEALAQLRSKGVLPIVVSASTEEAAAAARDLGAAEVLLKPVDVDALRHACEKWAISPPTKEPVAAGLKQAQSKAQSGAKHESDYVTASPVMQKMLEVAWRVAPTPASVLILGENGTGKNVLAKAIHHRSERKQRAFTTVHCPCLQEQLLESDLFGHVKGSFTGATADALGKVAAAEGGTLFLDEIGDLPLSIQPKLLRLLQERKYERVGETTQRHADIRVIAATNRDLQAEVKAGRFREDLYYRLNVVSVEVLPLRERMEDIIPMAEFFLRAISESLHRTFTGFSPLACETLRAYRWPGNVRELRNAVERAAILTDRECLDVPDFSQLVQDAQSVGPRVGEFVSVDALVEEHIRLVVARAASLDHAAEILQIDRSTLYRKRRRWQDSAPIVEFADQADAGASWHLDQQVRPVAG